MEYWSGGVMENRFAAPPTLQYSSSPLLLIVMVKLTNRFARVTERDILQIAPLHIFRNGYRAIPQYIHITTHFIVIPAIDDSLGDRHPDN